MSMNLNSYILQLTLFVWFFQLKDEQLSLYVSEFAAANYGSVFAQIREVNRESRSECEFLIKSLRILRNTGRNLVILDNMAW